MLFSTLFLPLVGAIVTPQAEQASGSVLLQSNQVQISGVSTTGTGCPTGTVSTTFSTDKTIVTLGFDEFQVYIGPGTTQADHSKSCQMVLSLVYPKGYRFSVAQTTFHGFANLDEGVSAFFDTLVYFSHAANMVTKFTASTGSSVGGAAVPAASKAPLVASGTKGSFTRAYVAVECVPSTWVPNFTLYSRKPR